MLEVVLPRCTSRDRLLRLDTGAWAQKHGVLGLSGVAHPDSLSDGKRQFTPQATESSNRPPRLTWSRSGVSKSGLYPAPCGAIQGEYTPKKITSVSPGGSSLRGVPWSLHPYSSTRPDSAYPRNTFQSTDRQETDNLRTGGSKREREKRRLRVWTSFHGPKPSDGCDDFDFLFSWYHVPGFCGAAGSAMTTPYFAQASRSLFSTWFMRRINSSS